MRAKGSTLRHLAASSARKPRYLRSSAWWSRVGPAACTQVPRSRSQDSRTECRQRRPTRSACGARHFGSRKPAIPRGKRQRVDAPRETWGATATQPSRALAASPAESTLASTSDAPRRRRRPRRKLRLRSHYRRNAFAQDLPSPKGDAKDSPVVTLTTPNLVAATKAHGHRPPSRSVAVSLWIC